MGGDFESGEGISGIRNRNLMCKTGRSYVGRRWRLRENTGCVLIVGIGLVCITLRPNFGVGR